MSDIAQPRRRRWYLWSGLAVVLVVAAGLSYVALSMRYSGDYYQDGKRYLEKGDLRAAVIQLRNAVRTEPKRAEARVALAAVYMRLGDPASSEKELRTASELGYDQNKLVVELAHAYVLQGKYDKLLQDFPPGDRGEKIEAALTVERGFAHFGLRQLAAAETDFKDANKKGGSQPMAYIGLARIELSRHNIAEAEKLVDQALAEAPLLAEALGLKGELRRLNKDYPGAIAAFDKALSVEPNLRMARIGRAVTYIDENKLDEAQIDVKSILSAAPRHPIGNYLQALIQVKRRQAPAALDTLQKAGSALAGYPPALYLLASLQAGKNQLEQAESTLKQYLDAVPNSVPGHKLYGSIMVRKGNPKRAIEIFTEALKLAPEDPQLFSLLANAYMRNNQNSEAAKWFDRAAAVAPDTAAGHTRTALERMQINQPDEAIKELEKAVDLDPSATQARILLILAQLRQGKLVEAATAAEGLRKELPESPIPYNMLGAVEIAKNNYDGARADFQKALQLQATFVPAMLNLAQLDAKQGKYDDAAKTLQEVLKTDPKNIDAFTALEQLALTQKRPEEAISWLQKAQLADPASSVPRLRLIDLYMRMGETAKATTAAQDLQQLKPNDPAAVEALARVQLAVGDGLAAVASYRQLAALVPKSAEVQDRLGRALLETKNTSGAMDAFRQAVALDPNYVPAQLELVDLELKSGNADGALKRATDWRDAHPKSSIGDAMVGEVYSRQGKFREAGNSFGDAMKKQPTGEMLVRRVNALVRSGEAKQAESELKDWIGAHKNDAQVRFALASLYMGEKRYDEALSEHESLLAELKDNPILLNNLAWLYGQRGDPRAVEFGERAYKLAPTSPAVADTLGYLLVKRQQAERGVELLQAAHDRAPGSPEIAYHLAVGLKAVGKPEQARAVLEPALATGAKFDEVEQAQKLLQELTHK